MNVKLYLLIFLCYFSFAEDGFAQSPGVRNSGPLPQYGFMFNAKRSIDNNIIYAGTDSVFKSHNKQQLLEKSLYRYMSIRKVSLGMNAYFSTEYWYYPGAFINFYENSDQSVVAVGVMDTSLYFKDSTLVINKIGTNGISHWTRKYGGNRYDRGMDIIPLTNSNGYLVLGATTSNDGNIEGNHGVGSSDVWILKVDENGNLMEQKCYGGSDEEVAYAIIATPDGGYIIVGSSTSSDGDLTGQGNHGEADGWVFKINNSGEIVWQQILGGSQKDVLNSIVASPDGGFLISGYTFSTDGDIQGNHGEADVWVIKLDQEGNLIWSKCFGGSAEDYSLKIQRTFTNEYNIAGFTYSNDGDITVHNGGADMLAIAISSTGDLLWEKCIGNEYDDFAVAALPGNVNETLVVGAGFMNDEGQYNYYQGYFAELGKFNRIKGTLFFDANSNGLKDDDETAFDEAFMVTESPDFTRTTVPNNGYFEFITESGNYTTSVSLYNNSYFTVVPVSRNSVFADYFNTDSISFAIQPGPEAKDLTIELIPLTPLRPGFTTRYLIKYKNAGNTSVSNAVISFQRHALMNNISSNITPASIDENLITWELGNLLPLQGGQIELWFTAAPPPDLNNGDQLELLSWIDPIANDVTPQNDTATLKQVASGSYDPNDKNEANAGVITPEQVSNGEYLNYTIRFQNTGTDTAFTVIVRDTLGSHLDLTSFQMVVASHPYILQIDNENQLTWVFNDILLPDSVIDEPNSHGYISYKIKPSSSVAVGDTINNEASIYFDYNLPVVTNTAQTLVMIESALPVTLLSFTGQLKDKKANLNWTTSYEDAVKAFEIQRSVNGIDYVSIGTVKASNLASGSSYLYTDARPANGYNYYRLNIIDIDGTFSYTETVVLNNRPDGSLISSIYPNPTDGKLSLDLQSSVSGEVVIQVLSTAGVEVLQKRISKHGDGIIQVPLDIRHLKTGHYFIRIMVNGKVEIHRLMKM